MFNPRPLQRRVLEYRSGKMGVSAVPGSGKTHTLSCLAATLIAEDLVREDQEVLIVTLMNSAVENFNNRVDAFIKEQGLLPNTGYCVRTLHGLAHDIIKERPDLAGLSDDFQIIDEREADVILNNVVNSWLRLNNGFISTYTIKDTSSFQDTAIRRDWQNLAVSIGRSFIRSAKDHQAGPKTIQEKLEGLDYPIPLLGMGFDIYTNYQRALNYRSAIDFDDLIRYALLALKSDPEFIERLRYRWPYILEDEAQDSNLLQEEILRLLAGNDGNWVRVGDPNQAIFETFTTAHPRYLRHFLKESDVIRRELPNSGRSTISIIQLANYLIEWTLSNTNPHIELRDALSLPYIEPTPPGDPQPNPSVETQRIHISANKMQPDEEISLIVKSIKKWLPENPDKTVAILVPRNERGSKVVEQLRKNNIEYLELLRSSLPTRKTAETLAIILQYLSDPISTTRLVKVYDELKKKDRENPETSSVIQKTSNLLKTCNYLEEFFWPRPDRDWISTLIEMQISIEIIQELTWLRGLLRRWQNATLLPIDQLVLTLAQDIFFQPDELALTHKLALFLEQTAKNHPDWMLPAFVDELRVISNNHRRFIGFSSEDSGFNPDEHKGKVIVATMHKAKGLEWDRVYLTSINNYDFPYAQPNDSYIGEKWYIERNYNLQEEILAKLKALIENDQIGLNIEEGIATTEARMEYTSERLRLLYVGITRARTELIITWNTGKNGRLNSSVPLQALQQFWEQRSNEFTI
ncbi:MAG: ATP-dependent helicase [Anaerolineaceae bacterium]|nr:ATP-dependent helicase [Anaerolineaceae bacterium]